MPLWIDSTISESRQLHRHPLSVRDWLPVIGSICSSQTPHREFDLSVWQLSPLLNHCHVAALRKLTENFASLKASRFDRQPESLSRRFSISLAPVGYALGKNARSVVHVATPKCENRSI
jgi:hypothetical protein